MEIYPLQFQEADYDLWLATTWDKNVFFIILYKHTVICPEVIGNSYHITKLD